MFAQQDTDQSVDQVFAASSPWASPSQRAAQQRNKRTALLATAARLFKQNGFASTSLEQVAAQLGISKPTLYYYVRSKSELVHACAMQGLASAQAGVQKALQSGCGAVLAKALKAYASAAASDFGWCMVRVTEYAQPERYQQEQAQQRQALEQGLLTVTNPELPAPLLLRALEGVVLALPQTQWSKAIGLLTAGQVQPPSPVLSSLSKKEEVVPEKVVLPAPVVPDSTASVVPTVLEAPMAAEALVTASAKKVRVARPAVDATAGPVPHQAQAVAKETQARKRLRAQPAQAVEEQISLF